MKTTHCTGRSGSPGTRYLTAWQGMLVAAGMLAVLLVSTGLRSAAAGEPAAQPATPDGPEPNRQPEQAGEQPAPQQPPAEQQSDASTQPNPLQPEQPSVIPGGPLVLNFRDATAAAVVEYLSAAAGLVVVQEVPIEGRITLLSQQPVSVDEAVSLLDSVLRAKNLAAVRNGRTLKIVTVDQAKRELVPVLFGNEPEAIPPTDRIVTQVIPIRYADAVKLKTDLATLIPAGADVTTNAASNSLIITSTQASIRRIAEIIRAIDVHTSEVSQVKVFQLRNADATSAAKLITETFKQDQPAQQQSAMPFPFRRGFMREGMGPQEETQQTEQKGTLKVTASADTRTNTLVVSAPPDVLKVIDTAPDPEWKLLIAFARFQGLRIPSEALALTWFDVDFEHKRLVIRASKTEHHEGGGVRVQPIFPETAPLLQAVFDAAPEGVAHVITRYRDPTQNLRTQFERYITKAGLRPWVKLWQNLRASRATELADRFPSHVCAAWLGHTEQVADQHYRIVTDEHFARAVGDLVAQIPAHFSLERECPERNGEHAACERTLETKAVPFGALECPSEPYRGLGVTGLEPVTSSV